MIASKNMILNLIKTAIKLATELRVSITRLESGVSCHQPSFVVMKATYFDNNEN